MWVYEKNASTDRYEVGYYDPKGDWHMESSWQYKDEAATRVNFLNGGKIMNKQVEEAAHRGFAGS